MLHAEVRGQGPRVVLLHGFTQNGRCWGLFGEQVAEKHETVFVDLPGHGDSHHDDENLERACELVAEVGGRGTFIGYSLGGRVALHVALRFPDLVEGLVLIGATAGLRTSAERDQRIAADEALAQKIESIGLDAFLTTWLAQPLFAGLREEAAALPERQRNRRDAMAASLRAAGTGRQGDLWPELATISCPTLILTGENDAKFTMTGQELRHSIGMRAELVTIRNAGHSVHLESPNETWNVVHEWISRVSSSGNQ